MKFKKKIIATNFVIGISYFKYKINIGKPKVSTILYNNINKT